MVRNKAAEVCEKYLSKGDLIYVEGRLKTRQWQGEDGNTRYTTEIQVTDFTFLSNRNDPTGPPQGNAPSRESSAGQSSQGGQRPAPVDTPEEEDDLPF